MSDAPPRTRPSRTTAIVVLLLAAVAATAVASVSASKGAPKPPPAHIAVVPARFRSDGVMPNASQLATDLAQPVVPFRVVGESPFDAAITESAVAGCVAAARTAVGGPDRATVTARYGDLDATRGRPDSLIVEGTIAGRVWHCASTRRFDGAVATRTMVLERVWPGVAPEFPTVRAVTVAAVESCMRRVSRLFPEFVFRGVRHEQRGELLYVTGDAFPLNNGDLVGKFSCNATVRGGRIVDAIASDHP